MRALRSLLAFDVHANFWQCGFAGELCGAVAGFRRVVFLERICFGSRKEIIE
jgi:hypothetical protein